MLNTFDRKMVLNPQLAAAKKDGPKKVRLFFRRSPGDDVRRPEESDQLR